MYYLKRLKYVIDDIFTQEPIKVMIYAGILIVIILAIILMKLIQLGY